ncbi:hypothetical protein FRB98_000301 [Tulasnella sp. 332]|nr:hypothetical protein FRB98_000301 [Tulasnella sp. 332]
MNHPSHINTAQPAMDQYPTQNSLLYSRDAPIRSDFNASGSFSEADKTVYTSGSPISPLSPICQPSQAIEQVSTSAEVSRATPRPNPSPSPNPDRNSDRDSATLKKILEATVPESVELLRQGRIASCQAAAVVAALFAGVEASIIGIEIGMSPTSGGPRFHRLLLIISYAALILNASTTFTSLLLIDRLGELPFMRVVHDPEVTETSLRTGRKVLGIYGASGHTWNFVEYHYFFTLIAGGFAVFSQILVMIWCYEGKAVAIPATVVIGISILPFCSIFVW